MLILKDSKPGKPLLLHEEPIYLNDKIFTNYETVVFEDSNITTVIEGINTADTDAQYQKRPHGVNHEKKKGKPSLA